MIEFRDNQWKVASANPAAKLEDRLPAFVPDWLPGSSGPGRALVEVAEQFAGMLETRVAQAPDKAKLAFLDTLGVEPIPPQPARCPVVFELMPGATHSRAPERTPLGAPASGGGDSLVFETESTIALAASRLVEVKAVLPDNRYVDHTQDVIGQKTFELFVGSRQIPRELYLAHERIFAVTPSADSLIELQWELAPTIQGDESPPRTLQWEYWDGGGWTPFAPFPPAKAATEKVADRSKSEEPKDEIQDDSFAVVEYSEDGTRSLTRSGTIRLRTSGKPADQTTIRGIKSYWIRARQLPDDLNSPSSASAASRPTFPPIDRIQLRGISKVGGFKLGKQPITGLRESAVSTNIHVRLVDDSGVPLDPNQYDVTFDRQPAMKEMRGQDPVCSFTLDASDAVKTHLLKVQSKGLRPIRYWPDINLGLLQADRDYVIDIARAGLLPTLVFANGVNTDPTIVYQPFGAQPQAGATFVFACPEVFGKPDAKVTIFIDSGTSKLTTKTFNPVPVVRWEYWNGLVWAPLPDLKTSATGAVESAEILSFQKSGEIQFRVPANFAVKQEFGQEQLWVRAHLATGTYAVVDGGMVRIPKNSAEHQNEVTFEKVFAPVVSRLRLEYEYISPPEAAVACLTHNDFHWEDVTIAAAFGGLPFTPFLASQDVRPSLYFGFTNSLPADLVSLYINVERNRREPDLVWEYHDGLGWRRLLLERDETDGLSQPGLVQFIWPGTPLLPAPEPVSKAEDRTITFLDSRIGARFRQGDHVAVFQDDNSETAVVAKSVNGSLTLTSPLENKFSSATAGVSPLARFGSPRHWIRAVWQRTTIPQRGDPDAIRMSGVFLNAVWAQQTKSVLNEMIGSTSGRDGESFDTQNRPVLRSGERVEILELEGALANAGWAQLLEELKKSGRTDPEGDLKREYDSKTNRVVRAWVRWEGRPNFAGSKSDDRHYVMERIPGRLQFGNGQAGRVPPINPNNIRISYCSGGGSNGNVPARTIAVVLGGVSAVQSVFNPIAASGGADGELTTSRDHLQLVSAISTRGPQLIRHRHRALTAQDYEQLARAASPGVASARVVTAAGSRCLVPAGSVQVVILPYAGVSEPEPKPSRELIREVTLYLKLRAPAAIAGRVIVDVPTYFRVGVETRLVPKSADSAGQLSRLATAAIGRYLHPVVGGPQGSGWGFGTAIRRSDLIKWLHHQPLLVPHLAYVQVLHLLESGTAVSEELPIPADQVACAGPIRVIVGSVEEACQ